MQFTIIGINLLVHLFLYAYYFLSELKIDLTPVKKVSEKEGAVGAVCEKFAAVFIICFLVFGVDLRFHFAFPWLPLVSHHHPNYSIHRWSGCFHGCNHCSCVVGSNTEKLGTRTAVQRELAGKFL
jgi:hypothetical protein